MDPQVLAHRLRHPTQSHQPRGSAAGRENPSVAVLGQSHVYAAESFDPRLKVRLLVLQPTPFCNIACDYCYLAERESRRFMSLETVEASVRNILESGLLGEELPVVWHAGEPLIASRAFYADAFDMVKRLAGPHVHVSHSIQTNGMLISDSWCDLFRKYDVRVGVSVDGPAFLHDRHRKTRSGKPTHAAVMRGIQALQSNGIPFHVIAVATRDTLQHADAFIEFFAEHKVGYVGINIEEQEGVHHSSTLQGNDEQYEAFLSRLYFRASQEPGMPAIRELEQARRIITDGIPVVSIDGRAMPYNDQVMPFAITTVDHDGNFSCFSPELIDQIHPEYGRFVFGNVLRDRMIAALGNDHFCRIFDAILGGVARCKSTCEYYNSCGGGAPVNKLNETGSFCATETDYCRRTIQRPIAIALEMLERELFGSDHKKRT